MDTIGVRFPQPLFIAILYGGYYYQKHSDFVVNHFQLSQFFSTTVSFIVFPLFPIHSILWGLDQLPCTCGHVLILRSQCSWTPHATLPLVEETHYSPAIGKSQRVRVTELFFLLFLECCFCVCVCVYVCVCVFSHPVICVVQLLFS